MQTFPKVTVCTRAALVYLFFGAAFAGQTVHAQSTSLRLRAVPNTTTLNAGDTLTISFYLDVLSLEPDDNYTALRAYLSYASDPPGGAAPQSPFAQTPTLTTFTGNGSSSGFANTTLSNPASSATQSGVADFVGFSFSENNGASARTDLGTFFVAQATGTLRSDLASGSYEFAFRELGAGSPARTFATGRFGPNNTAGLFPPDLITQAFTLNVTGGAVVPEPGSCALLCSLFLCGLVALRRPRL